MNRRMVLRTGSILAGLSATGSRVFPVFAQDATPVASPAFGGDGNDPTARELIARLGTITPLALLEALETAEVTEPSLLALETGPEIHAVPWTYMLDTDLEHSLGGVIIQGDTRDLHDPESSPVGGYIIFESAEIAYQQLLKSLGPEPNYASTYAAGTKVWLMEETGDALGIMRIGYVIAMASNGSGASEGIVRHLDSVSRSLT